MAKTGINFERCKVAAAEKHNTRDAAYIAAVNASPKKKYSIFEDQTRNNVSWINPAYEGKSLPQLLDDCRKLYRAKVGQAPQEKDRVREVKDKKTGMTRTVTTAGWSPIREGVCPVMEDTKPEDFRAFSEWLATKGLHVIRIDIHHDEGYTDPLTGDRKYNHHAHLVVDWTDHNTGKTAKLDKLDATEMQTQIALSLGMERGISKEITGADHLAPDQQRAKAAAEEIKKLQAAQNSLKRENAEITSIIRESCTTLQEVGRETVANFDSICDNAGAVIPTAEEKEKRDLLSKEASEDISYLDQKGLKKKTSTLRTLINATLNAIRRIGAQLQSLAAKLPDSKFHLFASSAQKAQILAIQADKEAEVNKIRSDADKALKTAEKYQKAAIRKANDAATAARQEAEAAKAEAKKHSDAAKEREQEATKKEKDAQELLDTLRMKLDAAKKEGYGDGYSAGSAEVKASHQQEVTDLKEEVEKQKNNAEYQREVKEFFRATNPYLTNAEQNLSELFRQKEWPLTKDEMIRIFTGEVVVKTHSEMRNYKKIELPVRIELANSDQGEMRVWYNDTTKAKCLKQLSEQVKLLGKNNGQSL